MGKRHLVATLIGEGVPEFEMSVACEVFGYDRSALAGGRPWYRHVLAAAGPDIRTMHGMRVDPEPGLAALKRADTIVIAPWRDGREVPAEVVGALRAAHKRGARLVTLCSGAFVLGATGLLDGRRATTHWAYVEEFARRFPNVKLDPGVLYVDDGELMTAAGSAAAIDLCLHIVRLDYGAETANAVARRLVVPPHRDGGQAQFIQQPMPADCDDPIGAVLDWTQEHLGEPLSVEVLAERAAMSPRTFARRFRQVTGSTPHQWLLNQRILLAQRLLETTDEPVEFVASRCGFGTAAGLRAHFQRVVGTSPLSYRRTFQRASALT